MSMVVGAEVNDDEDAQTWLNQYLNNFNAPNEQVMDDALKGPSVKPLVPLVDQKVKRATRALHTKKLREMQPTISTWNGGALVMRDRFRNNHRVDRVKENRGREIRRCNQILVEKIQEACAPHRPSQYSCMPPPSYPASRHKEAHIHRTLNYQTRRNERERIARENMALAKRIIEKKPTLSRMKWGIHSARHDSKLHNIARFVEVRRGSKTARDLCRLQSHPGIPGPSILPPLSSLRSNSAGEQSILAVAYADTSIPLPHPEEDDSDTYNPKAAYLQTPHGRYLCVAEGGKPSIVDKRADGEGVTASCEWSVVPVEDVARRRTPVVYLIHQKSNTFLSVKDGELVMTNEDQEELKTVWRLEKKKSGLVWFCAEQTGESLLSSPDGPTTSMTGSSDDESVYPSWCLTMPKET